MVMYYGGLGFEWCTFGGRVALKKKIRTYGWVSW